MTLSKGLKS